MTKGPPSKGRSPLRLVVAAIAFVALVCAGISLLLYKPSEEDRVQDQVGAMIRSFEKQDVPTLLAGIADQTRTSVDGDDEVLSKQEMETRLSRFYGFVDRISLSPKDMVIRIEGNVATVSFAFTYSTRYTNFMNRDRNKTPRAVVTLHKRDNIWIVSEVEIATQ